LVTTINSLDGNVEIVNLKSKISKVEEKLLNNDEKIHGLKMEYSNSYKNMETAIKDATSKAESNTKSMMDSIKSARDTIDDIAESVDNFHVIRIPLHGWFATSHARILERRLEVGLCSCTI
jgi:predicted  nucleic acid-binding Zn-ribbon protein